MNSGRRPSLLVAYWYRDFARWNMLADGSNLQKHAARRQGSSEDWSRQPIGYELSSSDALLLVINACQKIIALTSYL